MFGRCREFLSHWSWLSHHSCTPTFILWREIDKWLLKQLWYKETEGDSRKNRHFHHFVFRSEWWQVRKLNRAWYIWNKNHIKKQMMWLGEPLSRWELVVGRLGGGWRRFGDSKVNLNVFGCLCKILIPMCTRLGEGSYIQWGVHIYTYIQSNQIL